MSTSNARIADDSLTATNVRKPLTGLLSIRIHAIHDVDHPSATRWSKKIDTYVAIKVEDEIKGRTKVTRNDKWTDESLEIPIDKGNEIELTVYDKAGSDAPLPVGMIWIRISDIVEEMRRKKIETELAGAGWVSADRTVEDANLPRPDLQFNPPPGSSGASPSNFAGGSYANATSGPPPQIGPVIIDSWFSLEPVGRIQLSLSFGELRQAVMNNQAYLLTESQPNRLESENRSMRDWGARAPSVSARKMSTSFMDTSSSPNSSTASCGARSAASCSSTRWACSVPTANISVTRNATLRWSRNASAGRMPRVIPARPSCNTAYPIDGRHTGTSAPTGAVTVAISCPSVARLPESVKVCHTHFAISQSFLLTGFRQNVNLRAMPTALTSFPTFVVCP